MVNALIKLGADIRKGMIWIRKEEPLTVLSENHVQITKVLVKNGFSLKLTSPAALQMLMLLLANRQQAASHDVDNATWEIFKELLRENALAPARQVGNLIDTYHTNS